MPKFVVKQPNGLFAIFSSVVDDFTITDMTFDEAVAEIGSEAAAQRAVDDVELTSQTSDNPAEMVSLWQHHEGLARWHYCLSEILFYHGWRRLKEVLSKTEDPKE